MRTFVTASISALLVLWPLVVPRASAHPGSGIVVDDKGQVFFTDTGNPDASFSGHVWKIDAQGRLTSVHTTGAHWLALDATGGFARADLKGWFDQRLTPNFQRIPRSDANPTLLQTDGVPFVVHRDGHLYYANRHAEVVRLSPDGTRTLLAPDLSKAAERLGGIKGLAAAPDGSLYMAYPRAVQKITPAGAVTTVADPVVAPDCDRDVPADIPEPYLRGLAVDGRGRVYAAAAGCRCVVTIAPGGKVETVLKAERPWSPTGVAVHGGDVYVLEYTNANGKPVEWRPRVRKLGRDSQVTTLATVSREGGPGRPR
jgi:sugar lactone lactonase YvrE